MAEEDDTTGFFQISEINNMHLNIKTSNEATFGFDVEVGTLVKDLKQLIADHYKGKESIGSKSGLCLCWLSFVL